MLASSSTVEQSQLAAERARHEVRPGFSLPAYYYAAPERYAQDLQVLRRETWFLAGHVAQIPRAGDYFLFELANESIVILRSKEGGVNAFFNVCRHRGSRICLESRGHANLLVCPYHSWSYNLEGRLIGSRDMPEGFAAADYGLKRCNVETLDGLIFVNLARAGEAPSFESFASRMKPFLAPYQLSSTKVAAHEVLTCEANWKLVVENFAECYHCPGAHKEYSRTHRLDTMMAVSSQSTDSGGEADWMERLKRQGLFVEPFFDDPSSFRLQASMRLQIGGDSLSGGPDGRPMAPKLGQLSEWSGSWTAAVFDPFSQVGCYDDHAVLFTFVPRAVDRTDCIMTWLVRDDAVEGKDYRAEAVKHMWTITMQEDKTICANNQLGVSSDAYQPGPYSKTESRASEIVDWYLRHFVDAGVRRS